MATTRCTWVVSYDVADDKRRARVARRLQARGQRVQWSVFELLCTEAELNALLGSLRRPATFDAETDSLRAWRICSDCQHVAQAHGVGPAIARPGAPLVI
jgi:CRISPR-associated protein Cas2